MHEVLVNRLGGLSLPRKSVVRLTDGPDMTLDVYRVRKTTIQQQAIRVCGQKTNIIGRSRPHKSLILLPMWRLHPCVIYEACKMQQLLSVFFHLHLPTPAPFLRGKFFPIKVEPCLERFHHLRNTNRKSQKLSPIDKKKNRKRWQYIPTP